MDLMLARMKPHSSLSVAAARVQRRAPLILTLAVALLVGGCGAGGEPSASGESSAQKALGDITQQDKDAISDYGRAEEWPTQYGMLTRAASREDVADMRI